MRFLLSSSQKSETKILSSKKAPPASARSSKSVPPSSSRSSSAKKKNTRVETVKKVEIKKTIIKKKSKKASLEPETITTKSETAPAKDVDKCLLCQWAFPMSFRGEEKNVHMGRCMENLGEQDKKFWAQCYGDLKRYQFNFEENQSVRSVSRKPKEKSAKKSSKTKEEKKRSESPEEKKPRKKKDKDESITSKKEKKGKKDKMQEEKPKKEKKNKKNNEEAKAGKRSRKDEDLVNSQFEPLNMKKIKIEEGTQNNEVVIQIKKKQNYTKILMLPVVKQLIFDPSKEFRKKSRRKENIKS